LLALFVVSLLNRYATVLRRLVRTYSMRVLR
jgi:hypothetical protein